MASSDSRSANTRRDQVYLFHYYFSQNLSGFWAIFLFFLRSYTLCLFRPSVWALGELVNIRRNA